MSVIHTGKMPVLQLSGEGGNEVKLAVVDGLELIAKGARPSRYQQSTEDYQSLQKPGARIFVRSTSFVGSAAAAVYDRRIRTMRHSDSALTERRYRKAPAKKLLRKKKNESWAMRRLLAI